MPQGQANVVESLEQTELAERIDFKVRPKSMYIRHSLFLQ